MIDCDFPGGNIVIERVEGDVIYLHQDLRDTEGDWFYWAFRLRGAGGRRLRFVFTQSRALGVRGPGVSYDGGVNWSWLGAECARGNAFEYTAPSAADDIRFSFAMAYQQSHWETFVARLGSSPLIRPGILCVTPKGRPVEYLTTRCMGAAPDHRVALTCRHHCCEMVANYVLEGLLDYALLAQDPSAQWLRTHVEFFAVPFVDKDGCEAGDQGKNRRPRDHGRDYQGTSIHTETAAIREALPAWGGGRLHAAIDIHCPWIAGEHNEVIYLVGSDVPRRAEQQVAFSAILEHQQRSPLPFAASDFLPFGTAWNKADNYNSGCGFSTWADGLANMRLSTSIEVPYANVKGIEVTPASTRAFGADMARALHGYLAGS